MVDVTAVAKPGENDFRVQVENAQAGPTGLLMRLDVQTTDGRSFQLVTDEQWCATDQPGENWHERPLAWQEWPACQVLGEYGMGPWGKATQRELNLPPVPFFRHPFAVTGSIRQATVYVSAQGICDVHLNGTRIHRDLFTPGWTDYHRRVYYRAFDVTNQLQPGENVLGGLLADGWYSGYIGWGKIRNHYGSQPRIRIQLNIEYADGSRQVVATNSDWKASYGPIREADFLMGETYDARQELRGWCAAGYDASNWQPVVTGAEVNPVLQAAPGPPVVAIEEFSPVRIEEPQPGIYVADLGQNFAGFVRLKIQGQSGQRITLRFAERLNPDGTVYTTNLREARCIDTYICRGGTEETWEPRFTFHGFQYVEITGLSSPPTTDSITGVAISSDTPLVGRFACSDPMLNRLQDNVYWTQRSNFIDIPTDCPQRDERLGWTGDAQVYIRTATLNTDVQAFFNKWLVDLTDGQRADGQFPMVAPVRVAGDDGGPAWADAGVICPWTVYRVYGDRRLLERQYDSMVRFIDFCQKRSTPELLPPNQFHCFGDWLSIKADTPKEVIYTAYFAYSTQLMAKAATALGKEDDAARFQELFQQIKAAFNRAYVAEDGQIQGNTQCVYVLALAFDLLDPPQRDRAAQYLVEDIEARGGHLSTGFVGTKDLMLVLAKIGRNDVAYRLLHNDTFPSWGFSIRHGATSIWERWDGWTPENGFQDPGMNSFAHYSFGAVYQWMVENMGGIRDADVAYKRITIAPQIDDRLSFADIEYHSIRGKILSAWKRQDQKLEWTVEIPPNTTARVILPGQTPQSIRESGQEVSQAAGVHGVQVQNGNVHIEIGSGQYRFESDLP